MGLEIINRNVASVVPAPRIEPNEITILAPEQITVQRIGTPGAPAVFVAADYSVPVSLPGYSFVLHFTPSSGNRQL